MLSSFGTQSQTGTAGTWPGPNLMRKTIKSKSS